MSLPAGGFITTRDGKRCTAVPKTTQKNDNNSDQTKTIANPAVNVVGVNTASAAQEVQAATTADAQPPEATPDLVVESSVDDAVLALPSPLADTNPEVNAVTDVAQPEILTTPTLTPILTPTPTPTPTPVPTSQQQVTQQESDSVTTPPIVVPGTTTSNSVPSSISTPSAAEFDKSDLGSQFNSLISSSTRETTLIAPPPTDSPSPTLPNMAAESIAMNSVTPPAKVPVARLVGGIVGGLSFVAVLGCLWLYFIRRRRKRDTLLTPLWVQPEKGAPSTYYEIDNASVGPTSTGDKWKAKASSHFHNLVGAVGGFTGFKALPFNGRHSPTPSVNLNRGNSQFIESLDSLSTHSRSVSSFSRDVVLTRRERAKEWWDRLTADAVFNWALLRGTNPTTKEPPSHFTRSRSASPSAGVPSQNLTEYLASKDRELRDAAADHQDHRRSVSLPPPTRPRSELGTGSLGIDFSDMGLNPFADPRGADQPQQRPPQALKANPFADPTPGNGAGISPPQPAANSHYIAGVRRSRGQSFSTPGGGGWRYPSTIRMSKDSVLSNSTTNTRRGKGRSDPFDLEQPELLREPMLNLNTGRMSTLSDVEEQSSTTGSIEEHQTKTRISQAVNQAAVYNNDRQQQRIGSVSVGRPRVVSLLKKENSLHRHVEGERGHGSSAAGVGVGHESWTSRYSRGSSVSFSGWGDPGPDLGPRGGYQPPAGDGGVGRAV